MKKRSSTPSEPENARVRQRLLQVRSALLNLHKTLVDSERVSYEKTVGEVKSPNHFLQLLISDPWFVWLHPLSELIVSMDEALGDKEPLTTADVDALARESALLLVPKEGGQEFSGHYFEALQRDPDVVLAHAEAIKLVRRRKSSH
jgi:hypothetical protein